MTRKQRKTVKYNYVNYKKKAKQRSIYFALTLAQFSELSTSACYFCGVPPCSEVNRYLNKKGQRTYDGLQAKLTIKECKEYTVLLNGVDRFENTLPYVGSNCVPCCKICNRAKGAASLESFYLWLARIVEYNSDHFKEKYNEEEEDYKY